MSKTLLWSRYGNSWTLPAVALSFLFIGFVKGSIPSPIDLTAVLAVVTAAIAMMHIKSINDLFTPLTVMLFVLIAWLAIRAAPDPNQWAIRKVGEVVIFGGPAFLAGFLISGDEDMRNNLARLVAWTGVPVSVFVVWQAATGNPYSFSAIGNDAYQLTGVFLAFCFIASAVLRWPVAFAISALGCAVSGNISGAAFGGVAVIGIWIARRDWRNAAACLGYTLALFGVYTVLVAPPLVFMRLIWKFGGSLLLLWDTPVTPFQAAEELSKHPVGRGVNSVMSVMPEESKAYLVEYSDRSRLSQFLMAWHKFLESPIVGHGYGSIEYLGNPYPHNVALELAAETGIIGILLFGSVLFFAFRNAVNDRLALALLSFALLTAMVSGYFGGRIFLFCLGMAGGAQHASFRK